VIEKSTSHPKLKIGRMQDADHFSIVEPFCDVSKISSQLEDAFIHANRYLLDLTSFRVPTTSPTRAATDSTKRLNTDLDIQVSDW
jgi:hypothetical protein